MVDRALRLARNLQAYGSPQRVAEQRNAVNIGEETPAVPVFGMAYVVARLDTLAGQFAASRHFVTQFIRPIILAS